MLLHRGYCSFLALSALQLAIISGSAHAQVTVNPDPASTGGVSDTLCAINGGEVVLKDTPGGCLTGGTESSINSLTFGTGAASSSISALTGNIIVRSDSDLLVEGEIKNNSGAVIVDDDAEVTGALSVGSNLAVTGTTTTDQLNANNANVAGTTTTDQLNANNANVAGTTTTGFLSVTNDATVGNDLAVMNNVSVGNDLGVTRDATVGRNLVVAGTTSTNTLNVGTGGLSVAAGAPISMGGNRVQDVATPIAGTDAVNKDYVDSGLAAANMRINNAFKKIDENTEGVAVAIAMGGIAIPQGKDFAVSANMGFYDSRQAFAAQSAIRLDETFTLNGGVGIGLNNNKVGGRIGVTAAW